MNIKNKLLVLAGLDPIIEAAPVLNPPTDVATVPNEVPAVEPAEDPSAIPPADLPANGNPEDDERKDKFWIVLPPLGSQASEQDVLALVSATELVQMIRGGKPEQDADIEIFSGDREEEAKAAADKKLSGIQGAGSEFTAGRDGGAVTDQMSYLNKAKTLVQNPVPADKSAATESVKEPTRDEKVEIQKKIKKIADKKWAYHQAEDAKEKEKKEKTKTESVVSEKIIPANKVKHDVLDLTNPDHKDGAVKAHLLGADAPGIKVPANVKAAVKASMKRAANDLKIAQDRASLDNRAGNLRPQQPADVDFYVDLLNAYQKIDALLDDGTEESLKQLQAFIPSLKNWMSKELPVELIKYVAHGCKPLLSVKDHFVDIKAFKTKGM